MATATKFVNSEPRETRLSIERHYSPAEIAELWNLSAECIRKLFEREPGVVVIGNHRKTLRIPQGVLDRVHRRMTNV